jgi:GST-like protein
VQTTRLFAAPFGGSAIIEAALTLCGVDFETIDRDFDQLEGWRPLEAINPLCQVPTLVLPDGRVLTESAAIVLCLGQQHPDARLVPSTDATDYAAFLRWLIYLVANVYPTFTYGDFPERWVDGREAQQKLVATTDARREAHWRYLESLASNGTSFLDSGFSALDLYVWVMSHWRPRRAWFRRECPRLFGIAEALDHDPRLAAVDARNFAGRG